MYWGKRKKTKNEDSDDELSWEDALRNLQKGFRKYINNKVLQKVELGNMGKLSFIG